MSTTHLRGRLFALNAAIFRQKAALGKLERDRNAVESELLAVATFPVVTLPIETTTEIFTLCLPPVEELREDRRVVLSKKLRSRAPTVFLGVCRAWRDIALTTPALWATFHLRFDYGIDFAVAQKPGEVEGFIDRWLERAALRPLSIILHTARSEDEDFADGPFTPSRMRDVIHRYAHRMQYLELNMSQHDLRQLGLDSTAFPILQRVVLGDRYGPEPTDLNPVILFSNAPQLDNFHLIYGGLFSYYTPPSLQLTIFEGEIDNLDIFAHALNLIEAQCSVEYLLPVPTSNVSHPKLQSLTLCTSHLSRQPVDILRYLTLPALQILHISKMEDTMYSSLSTFLTRSSPPLCTLSI
ncbi:hypothetical protein C8R43DRAFT_96056 [Mycena crocata]|nr:hypothetical protein C8R43DRAFT_96056 [Mycena crocata]